jgi:hypothetical protein
MPNLDLDALFKARGKTYGTPRLPPYDIQKYALKLIHEMPKGAQHVVARLDSPRGSPRSSTTVLHASGIRTNNTAASQRQR